MPENQNDRSRSGVLQDLASIGTRAAAVTMRPLTGAIGAAAEAGIGFERRAVDRLLDSDELERILVTTADSARVQAALRRALESDAAGNLIDGFFDSGLFDRFIDRLLSSDALWRLVEDIATSPAVTSAISGQGLGFADQLGGEMRTRSQKADDWLERAAHRFKHRDQETSPPAPDASPS
jgi:hypothetical protein